MWNSEISVEWTRCFLPWSVIGTVMNVLGSIVVRGIADRSPSGRTLSWRQGFIWHCRRYLGWWPHYCTLSHSVHMLNWRCSQGVGWRLSSLNQRHGWRYLDCWRHRCTPFHSIHTLNRRCSQDDGWWVISLSQWYGWRHVGCWRHCCSHS